MSDVAVVLDDVEFCGSAGTSKSYMVILVVSGKASTPELQSCFVVKKERKMLNLILTRYFAYLVGPQTNICPPEDNFPGALVSH